MLLLALGSCAYSLRESTDELIDSNPVMQVSWLRLRDPIPQLMSLNNVTNTLNTRFRALVTDWREFVLMVRDVRRGDAGQYECQVRFMNFGIWVKIVRPFQYFPFSNFFVFYA